ncbi:MAG TPA: hypothetical protein PLQ75_05865 [Anaerolineales bacterium]|nr:hypothetical protein [Saprospiraceae bacterium]HNE03031.1 hypothetical protein [Anaerolineales bacterium]HNF94155.1 hypothetical protein [Anaerolineales bacterium]
MPSKKKTSVTIQAAIITVVGTGFFALITSVLTPVIQHWLEKPTESTSDENSNIDPLIEYFPLFVGSTRTYTVGNSTPTTDGMEGLIEYISTYTEKVIFVESGAYEKIHIYKVEQSGEIYDLDCTTWETRQGPVNKWYITFENKLYTACSEDGKVAILQSLYEEIKSPDKTDKITPKIIFPIEIGNSWGAITAPGEDHMYKYNVEIKTSLSTPAGSFTDCYKIVFYTSGDSSIRYVCPGVGDVALEYHHYGNPINYRVELQSYSNADNK